VKDGGWRPVLPRLSGCARSSSLAARLALGCALAPLAACTTLETYMPAIESLGVYRLDINQGNYVSQDMVEKLKTGMSKPQVRTVLGTPLVTSIFRESRWDYVYEYQRQGRVIEHRQLSIYFVDDKLARWEGDEMPASQADLNREALARTSSEERWGSERSWWDSIVDIFK
jgi:outer membrane protein assembly factor BamE